LLDGAAAPAALAERAAELGMEALALTDHDGLYGAIEFGIACRKAGIRPLIGAELTLHDGAHVTLLARDRGGYATLCRLISAAQLAGGKGHARLPREALELCEGGAGLVVLSGCRAGAIPRLVLQRRYSEARAAAEEYRALFGPQNFWIELQNHLLGDDTLLNAALVELAEELGLGYVATNNVHYARTAEADLQDVLTCVREGIGVRDYHPARLTNLEYCLKRAREMEDLFVRWPRAVAATAEIAGECAVEMDFRGDRFPDFPLPAGVSAQERLRELCEAGLAATYGPGEQARARRQLAHELAVIERTELAEYFLIVWDLMRFAREQGIRGQGRGSAADSLAVYCLGITTIDPLAHNLLFERFLNEGRSGSPPDIDIDFQADRREEIIQYVYRTYGHEHAAMVCNIVTYRARSAIRDVGKVLGLPADTLDRLAKNMESWQPRAMRAEARRLEEMRPRLAPAPPEHTQARQGAEKEKETGSTWELLIRLCEEIEGTPRHLSIHVGGMLITRRPLLEIVPLERATMPGRVVVQWNKDSVEDAGLIKIDLLGLRMLAVLSEAVDLVAQGEGQPAGAAERAVGGKDGRLNLEGLPLDDPAVYALLRRGDTIGCFQVESRAQAQMVHRHRPENFNDIVVQVAIIRPGPIVGNMVHPYLRRRRGLEPVAYLHPRLEPVLKETLGVLLYQEQVMRVATELAGLDGSAADRLRRAITHQRVTREMEGLHEEFLAGCVRAGMAREGAEELFRQMAAFGQYGFCKSHAAAFAQTAYQSLYLKRYHPVEFYCALLNHQPMGFYSAAVVAGDARRHGVPLLGVDARYSDVRCTVEREPGGERAAIRLGYNYVDGIGEEGLARIADARASGEPFDGLRGFWQRTALPEKAIMGLIRVGAFDAWEADRRRLLWQAGELAPFLAEGGKKGRAMPLPWPMHGGEAPLLTPMDEWDEMEAERAVLGLTTRRHLFHLLRGGLQGDVLSGEALRFLPTNLRVRVAGLAVCRQRPPTAKGMVFLTLEDETGLINVILHPDIYERDRSIARLPALIAEGRLQKEGGAINVVARRLLRLEEIQRGRPAAPLLEGVQEEDAFTAARGHASLA
jgi:error-prone DNA polymerase